MSALPPKADMCGALVLMSALGQKSSPVHFAKSGHSSRQRACPPRGYSRTATGLSTALAYGPTSKICRPQIGWSPLQQGNEVEMLIRQLTVASLLSLAVISPGSTQAAKAPLALCQADAERICSGVAPGGGKIIACLKQHKDEVSVGCAKALKALKTKMGT
jgi:Cysteine rich repeat